jgi:hypothetical protein
MPLNVRVVSWSLGIFFRNFVCNLRCLWLSGPRGPARYVSVS